MFDFLDKEYDSQINTIDDILLLDINDYNADRILLFVHDNYISVNDPEYMLTHSLCLQLLNDINAKTWLNYMIDTKCKYHENISFYDKQEIDDIKYRFQLHHSRKPKHIEIINGLNQRIDKKKIYKKRMGTRNEKLHKPKKKPRKDDNVYKDNNSFKHRYENNSIGNDNQDDTYDKNIELDSVFIALVDRKVYQAKVTKTTKKQIRFIVPDYDDIRKFLINTKNKDMNHYRHREGILLLDNDPQSIEHFITKLEKEYVDNKPDLCYYCEKPLISIKNPNYKREKKEWDDRKYHKKCWEHMKLLNNKE